MLGEHGVSSKVVYFNRLFASRCDPELYVGAAAYFPLNSLLSDWIFSDDLLMDVDDRQYLSSLLRRKYITPSVIPAALHAKSLAGPFLDTILSNFDWSSVKVLALVDSFAKRDAVAGHLMAALALAKRIREHFPSIKIVLGGPYSEGAMGVALRAFPFLDFVVTGDIYSALPPVVLHWLRPGSSLEFRPSLSKQLNLPIPNFDDFFELRDDGLPGDFETLPMQNSLGCWWTKNSTCTFCALPGNAVKFVSKSAKDALEQFATQVERYNPRSIEFYDLIIDQHYFSTVFPNLDGGITKPEIFIETKAHLSTKQLEVLRAAGVNRIQAGIESLSASSLSLMSKGVSASRNVGFLKDCTDLGIFCYWNYLHSIPGETPENMLEALAIVDACMTFQPPTTFQPVRVERFSSYFREPEKFGLTNVRPDGTYRQIWGSAIDLSSFAFYFEHEEPGADHQGRYRAINRLRNALDSWKVEFGGPSEPLLSLS